MIPEVFNLPRLFVSNAYPSAYFSSSPQTFRGFFTLMLESCHYPPVSSTAHAFKCKDEASLSLVTFCLSLSLKFPQYLPPQTFLNQATIMHYLFAGLLALALQTSIASGHPGKHHRHHLTRENVSQLIFNKPPARELISRTARVSRERLHIPHLLPSCIRQRRRSTSNTSRRRSLSRHLRS